MPDAVVKAGKEICVMEGEFINREPASVNALRLMNDDDDVSLR